jgi:hypothetical protein
MSFSLCAHGIRCAHVDRRLTYRVSNRSTHEARNSVQGLVALSPPLTIKQRAVRSLNPPKHCYLRRGFSPEPGVVLLRTVEDR